ncbi:hypothetical protein JCM8208_002252 [Rhodotorula glutinis]
MPSPQPPLASSAPIGNSQDPEAYLAGRAAAVQYAEEHGYPLECAVEIATAWGDQDANAHVNNCVPLRWCETGRGTFMRAVARDISDERVRADLNGSGRGKGVIFGEVRYRYLRPVFHPDNILVLTHTNTISPKSLTVKTILFSYAQRALVGQADGVLFAYDYDAARSCEWDPVVVEGMVGRGARKVGFGGSEGEGERSKPKL